MSLPVAQRFDVEQGLRLRSPVQRWIIHWNRFPSSVIVSMALIVSLVYSGTAISERVSTLNTCKHKTLL